MTEAVKSFARDCIEPALRRAALQAVRIAEQNGTKLVIGRDGKVMHISPSEAREMIRQSESA